MKAYIFDLDGTLLDSMGVWEQIDVEFLQKRGYDVPPDYINAICSRSFPEAAEYTIERFGLRDTVDSLIQEWNSMAVYAYGNTVQMKTGARAYLERLKACGARLAVATSLPVSLYTPALKHHGIVDWFDVICSTDEVAHGKTRPDIYHLVAQRMGVEPRDCVMFEDIPQAMQSAKTAGMTVVGVYDESSKQHWTWIQEIADGVITSFEEAPMP